MAEAYQAIEQYDYITIRNIVVKILSIVILFICVRSSKDIVPYSIVSVIGTVGSNFLNLIRLPKLVDLETKYKLNIKQHLGPIFILFFYYAATTIYTNLDVVMLGFMTNNTTVGYYNASVKLKNVLVGVITALGAVALPRASYYLSNNESEKFVALIKKSLNYVLFVSVSLATFCTVQARPIILLLAGEGYTGAVNSMMWIMPSIIFIGIGSITAWQLLIPLGRDKCTLIGAITGAVVDFGVNWLLIPHYGAVGASIGTLCAEISVIIVHIIGLRDIIGQYVDKRNIFKILFGAVMATFSLFLFTRVTESFSPVITCLITGVVFFGCFAVIEFVLKEESIRKLWDTISNRLFK